MSSAPSAIGPSYSVDVAQIGVPVTTPRRERPKQHKRSLTGTFSDKDKRVNGIPDYLRVLLPFPGYRL